MAAPHPYGNTRLNDYSNPYLPSTSEMHSVESGINEFKPGHYPQSTQDLHVDMRGINRTPSPTPSEQAELKKKHIFDFKAMGNWRYWFRKDWIWYYVIAVILIVISVLFTVYHAQIVRWLQPPANRMQKLPAGWLIPIAILFVISFPPLFGHEIVAILCGVVWGLWPGFGIVCAGTFLGEIGNFYAFRYCCAARGEKLEKTKIQYACLARVVREGGFKIALIARFSAIPGHFTTAVFSTCGMNIWVFSIAAILSLPKQFITVYLGVALEQSEDGKSSKTDHIIKAVVIGMTVAVTIGAMWYIYHLMAKVKPQVIYERRKARQAKMAKVSGPKVYGNTSVLQSTTEFAYNPNVSESELPLTANFENPGFQQWDNQGKSQGYTGDPTLYAPQPQRPLTVTKANLSSPGSAQSLTRSTTGTPARNEQPHGSLPPLIQQNTSGSIASRDMQGYANGPDMYQTSRAPHYHDPYTTSPVLQTSYQSSPPPPAGAAAPYTAFAAPQAYHSPMQTHAQTQYPNFQPPAGPPPRTA